VRWSAEATAREALAISKKNAGPRVRVFCAHHTHRRDLTCRGGTASEAVALRFEVRPGDRARLRGGLNRGCRCCFNVSGGGHYGWGKRTCRARLRGPDADPGCSRSTWRSTPSSPACCLELFWPIGTHSAGAQMLLDDRRASHRQNIGRHVRNYRCTRPDNGARADLSARNDAGPRADKHVGSADHITSQVAARRYVNAIFDDVVMVDGCAGVDDGRGGLPEAGGWLFGSSCLLVARKAP